MNNQEMQVVERIFSEESGAADKRIDEKIPVGAFEKLAHLNSVDNWFECLRDPEGPWCTQVNFSVLSFMHYGQKAIPMMLSDDIDVNKYLKELHEKFLEDARYVAENCKKPFDIRIPATIQLEKTEYDEVPVVVKTGLFKKETQYEKRARKIVEKESVILQFNGWLLEHFERIHDLENDGLRVNKLYWDYCLGGDGRLYIITTSIDEYGSSEYRVDELFCMFPWLLNNLNQNVFVSVMHGWIGALDVVSMESSKDRKYMMQGDGTKYCFNFPLQIDSKEKCSFDVGDGLRERLKKLLHIV